MYVLSFLCVITGHISFTYILIDLIFPQAEKIREKTYNKQKVCVVNQDLMVSASGNVNIAEVDNRIRELTKENADHEAFIKRAQSEIKSMTSSMSIEDAEELLARVE